MIDAFGVKARVAAFDSENGGDGIVVGDMLIFSNGAMRDVNPMGALIDPPAEEYERLTNVARYWEERVTRARDRFDELKEHYHEQAKAALEERFVPEPVEDAAEAKRKLSELRSEVQQCQAKLDEARQNMEAAAPASRRMTARLELEKRSRAARKGNRELLSEIAKIKI